MKADYVAPKLVSFGDIDALTQYIGNSPVDDSFCNNGQLQVSDGSGDLINP
jgi:hypothetical protein